MVGWWSSQREGPGLGLTHGGCTERVQFKGGNLEAWARPVSFCRPQILFLLTFFL